MPTVKPGMAAKYLCCVVLILFTGCQDQSMVASLPPPNFNGPLIAPPPPLPRPVVATPAPVAVRPAPAGGPREWVPAGTPRAWRWIVIHHSATSTGDAASFDKMHRDKGWDELGYHFVIGNGTDSADGQIEVGPRWRTQKHGAHAKTPDNRFNDYGIGICLVGNFDNERPSARQMQALAKLTAFLMQRYNIPADRVLGHSDTGKATDCPGTNLNVAQVRRMAVAQLAGTDGQGAAAAAEPVTASSAHSEHAHAH